MDMSSLPPFWLAYLRDPSDSGRIHSNVRQRWLSGTHSHHHCASLQSNTEHIQQKMIET